VRRSHRITVGPLGPLIEVGLNVGANQAASGFGGPPLSRTGLIDTRATRTAISDAVYRVLRPAASGSTLYRRPGMAQAAVATHSIRLNFEGHLSGNPWFELDILVADPATPGVEVTGTGDAYPAVPDPEDGSWPAYPADRILDARENLLPGTNLTVVADDKRDSYGAGTRWVVVKIAGREGQWLVSRRALTRPE
jgi:hypothetical protein